MRKDSPEIWAAPFLKQIIMKLYTEEQVTQMIEKSRVTGLTAEYLIMTTDAIEIPSDDEIEKQLDEQEEYSYARLQGAIWMKEQILKQNK